MGLHAEYYVTCDAGLVLGCGGALQAQGEGQETALDAINYAKLAGWKIEGDILVPGGIIATCPPCQRDE